jgi:hypothetical protein
MHLIGQQSRVHIQKDKIMKIMLLSVAVGFTVAMAGCAFSAKSTKKVRGNTFLFFFIHKVITFEANY